MGADDEKIRLILEILGAKDIDAAKDAAGRLKDKLEEVAPSADKAAAAADKLAKGGGNSAQSMMQLGRVVQDFQGGGILGITNNMEGMAMALGLGPGIAGVATLAAVALAALNPQIKALIANLAGSHTKTEAEAMKELEENTHRTAEETARLNKFKEREAELGRILAGQTRQQKDTKSLVEEFLGGGQGEKILGGLAQALAASGRGAVMTDEQRRRANEMRIFPGMTAEEKAAERRRQEEAKAQVQRELDQANVEAAGRILGAAPTDRGARDTLRAMARRFPGAFPKGFAGQLGELEPEAVAAQDADVEAAEAEGIRAHEAGVARRERAKAKAKFDARDKREKDALRHAAGADRKKMEAEEGRAGEKARKDREKALEEHLAIAEGTDIDERAATEAATMRAAGGYQDRFGRFIKLDPNQQLRRLQGMIERELKQRFPRAAANERHDVALAMGERAHSGLQRAMEQNQARAMDAGLNAVAATQQAMMETIAEFRRLAQKAGMLQQSAGALKQRARGASNSGWN